MTFDSWNSLETAEQISVMFPHCELENPHRACSNLQTIAQLKIPFDLMQAMVHQLSEILPGISDPDMALNNLERFFAASRNALGLAALIQRDQSCLPILLKIFSSSQYLTDQLIRDPSSYDALRLAAGQPVTRELLVDEIDSQLQQILEDDDKAACTLIRRFKHRETLRIAFGDIIGRQNIETITAQISNLADAICTATLSFAARQLNHRYGLPKTRDGRPATISVLAMGKLGGRELNYSSDIDLVLVYSNEGNTDGKRATSNRDFFDRWGRRFVKLLTENTALGVAYRVDLRLRPGGSKAAIACSFDHALSYYDVQGRTWERQALVKARPIAGDIAMGNALLSQLQNWIYEKRVSLNEIVGIKGLKRQIERRSTLDGDEFTNVKTGWGGIRDIEFAIQFLQLLHGASSENIRTGNTLEAIDRLYQAGAISTQEKTLLDNNYRWLRRLEHRLQIMFDLQTHSLPESAIEKAKIARRMNFTEDDPFKLLQQFDHKLLEVTSQNRSILDHLLHNAFPGEDSGKETGREADLILDPLLPEESVISILKDFGFSNPLAAHRHLHLLANERNRFLSPRRCRHFLAAIANHLLHEIARTPDPDETLLNLTKVSESLGGKAALWELFQVHPPVLNLYVRLCTSCDYLCNILTRNPGMIDELTDALILQQLPDIQQLQTALQDLLVGAEDAEPIFRSFKDAHHLRVGIRDITGRDEIARTHRALSDVAETCISKIVASEEHALSERFGTPYDQDGNVIPLQVLAMGKLGGREPNYHSDLDVVFLYQGDGVSQTVGGRQSTNHQDYFSRLAANISKRVSKSGRWGKLYEIDSRLRPTGKSGSLAVSEKEFLRYFVNGDGQLWERLALCKGRPIYRTSESVVPLNQLIHTCVTSQPWLPQHAHEVGEMRIRMQEGASTRNIKRGPGGSVDVEFAIQMLQLKYASEFPDVLTPNTVQAANQLKTHQLIAESDFEFFQKSYNMLRWVEARLRLMNTASRHDMPDDEQSLAKLAMLLQYPNHHQLVSDVQYLRRENRRRFVALLDAHGPV